MRKTLLLTLILAFATTVFANTPLAQIINELPELKSTECKFRQEKFLPSSNITLKSSGDFRFEKDKGVTFYTTYPIKSTASYTSKEYRHINNVITAISNKSYLRLEKDFTFFFEKSGSVWDLKLVPKNDSAVSSYLKSIEIQGQDEIKKIVILASDSTRTAIYFSR